MYFSFFFLCFHDSIATTAKSNLLEAASICLRAADDKKKKNPRRKIPLKVGASVAVIRYVVVNGGAGYLNLSKAYLGGLLRRLT